MADLIRRKQPGEAWETAEDTGGGGLPDWWTVNSVPGSESVVFSVSDNSTAFKIEVPEDVVPWTNPAFWIQREGGQSGAFIVYGDYGLEIGYPVGIAVEDLSPRIAAYSMFGEIFVVGPTGAVTISPSDPAVAGLDVTGGGIKFPTADPQVAGAWWDNAGTLTKSAG